MPLASDTSFSLNKDGDAKDVTEAVEPGPPIAPVPAQNVRVYIALDVDMTKPAIIQRSIETLLRHAKTAYATSAPGIMHLWVEPGAAASSVVSILPGNDNYVSLEIGEDLADSSQSGLVAETTHQIANVIAERMKDN